MDENNKISISITIDPNDVYKLLVRIPNGKVTTYGDIAKQLGNKKLARSVGKILHNNPDPIIVPCHKVVLSNGKIGGYAYGLKMKKNLLKNEGIRILKDGTIENFHKIRVEY
jgi:methylated-DNA-[protein]-cysteine S-methyltransferase